MHKFDKTRRGFLTKATTVAASIGLGTIAPSIITAADDNETKKTSGEIIYRKLGKTGVELPIISMGVMNANNPEVIKASYDLGVRHFDTAGVYQYGRNEQMVGRVINNMGVRDKVFIATKIFYHEEYESYPADKRKDGFIECLNSSLKRLKMDYVDLLYIHNIMGDQNLSYMRDPGVIEGFKELKKQGKIRFAGVSTHRGMTAVINDVIENGFYDVVLTSFNISLASAPEFIATTKKAYDKGIGLIAMKTQVGGRQIPVPSSADNYSSTIINKAVLRWVANNKHICTAIPGYTNYEHMNNNFSIASDLEYSQEEKKFLKDNNIDFTLGFCHQCDGCKQTCPKNTDIPSLMRTHMYAAQYTNFHQAKLTYNEIPSDKGLQNCLSCDNCVAQCLNSVNIKSNIGNLIEIYT